jgi:hypothetical protein
MTQTLLHYGDELLFRVKIRRGSPPDDERRYDPFFEVRTVGRELRDPSTAVFFLVGDGGWSREPNERGMWIMRPRSKAARPAGAERYFETRSLRVVVRGLKPLKGRFTGLRYFNGASEDIDATDISLQVPANARALPSELHFTWDVETLPELEWRSVATALDTEDRRDAFRITLEFDVPLSWANRQSTSGVMRTSKLTAPIPTSKRSCSATPIPSRLVRAVPRALDAISCELKVARVLRRESARWTSGITAAGPVRERGHKLCAKPEPRRDSAVVIGQQIRYVLSLRAASRLRQLDGCMPDRIFEKPANPFGTGPKAARGSNKQVMYTVMLSNEAGARRGHWSKSAVHGSECWRAGYLVEETQPFYTRAVMNGAL